MLLYLLRHGQTAENAQRIVQGKGVNAALNEVGHSQAKAFFQAYQHVPFELFITSSLRRTQETISPFKQAFETIPHLVHPHLDEIGWGDFEGKASTPGLHAEYLSLIQAWGRGELHKSIENGETAEQIAARLYEWVDWLKTRTEKHLLVCTHGGILSFLMAILQKMPVSAMHQYKHRNTGLCRFEYHRDTDHFELLEHDNMEHFS
jgi:probable phosphoglycerate mutase